MIEEVQLFGQTEQLNSNVAYPTTSTYPTSSAE